MHEQIPLLQQRKSYYSERNKNCLMQSLIPKENEHITKNILNLL